MGTGEVLHPLAIGHVGAEQSIVTASPADASASGMAATSTPGRQHTVDASDAPLHRDLRGALPGRSAVVRRCGFSIMQFRLILEPPTIASFSP